MTIFARDYVQNIVPRDVYIWFDLWGLLPVALSLGGLVFILRKKSQLRDRIIGSIFFVIFGYLAYMRISILYRREQLYT